MPNLLAHYRLVGDIDFQGRCRACAVQAAILISGESGDAEPTPRSKLRQAYAGEVLAGTADLDSIAWALGANTTVQAGYIAGADGFHPFGNQANIPDGDLEYVIATVWDDLSGAARIPV